MPENEELNRKAILSNFDVKNWADWIDDILLHDNAHPVSQLTPDGDVLKDMFDYLAINHIDIGNYEEAYSIKLDEFLERIELFVDKIERLLLSLSIVKLPCTKKTIIKIIEKREYAFKKGQYDFLAVRALQILTKNSLLPKEIRVVYEQCNFYSINELKTDPTFIGCFLRFIRAKKGFIIFFDCFNNFIEKLDKIIDENPEDKGQFGEIFSTVFSGQIFNIHYEEKNQFYKVLFDWFVNSHKKFAKNNFYWSILKKIHTLFQRKDFQEEIGSTNYSSEIIFGKATNFILNFLFEPGNLQSLTNNEWKDYINLISKKDENFIQIIFELFPERIYDVFIAGTNNSIFNKKQTESLSYSKQSAYFITIVKIVLLIYADNLTKKSEHAKVISLRTSNRGDLEKLVNLN